MNLEVLMGMIGLAGAVIFGSYLFNPNLILLAIGSLGMSIGLLFLMTRGGEDK